VATGVTDAYDGSGIALAQGDYTLTCGADQYLTVVAGQTLTLDCVAGVD
jgi:hypothetical protein